MIWEISKSKQLYNQLIEQIIITKIRNKRTQKYYWLIQFLQKETINQYLVVDSMDQTHLGELQHLEQFPINY